MLRDRLYRWQGVIQYALWAAILGFFLQLLFEAFVIDDNGMAATLRRGDRMIVNHVSYWVRSPRRNEIILYRNTLNPAIHNMGRVIGLPGEEIVIKEGIVYVDGRPIEEHYLSEPTPFAGETRLPADCYFVMGDNRAGSRTVGSNVHGSIPRWDIKGKVDFVYWPLYRIRMP
jgi:signal peptidase I